MSRERWNSNPSSQASPNRQTAERAPSPVLAVTLAGVNEVVPWSTRTREAALAGGRRVGAVLRRAWDRFSDLGVGAWLLRAGVLVVSGLLVAIIQGRSGPEPVACDQAQPYVDTLTRMAHGEPLTSIQVGRLQNASSQLTALVPTAHGADRKAITDAARVAGGARAGRPLQADDVLIEFEATCTYGDGPGGGNRL